ncbi:MAG TPA: signal recognition particle-docking protein FtsY [Verrucomicrobiota bacterium]|nr:signal recognition particle-docking protein FtsY [Verrucomicrobiota bacterium]OQC23517.1 MAG: Signal recognition particle receptor FtsY [Verrucomicrobia bacterium ADurb.Bin063]HRR65892.1 signal recognition particle-docking protein FtsY [Candidatus Paceibacterota bacterium]MBP8016208.1 signal recognition particle-docking protein FtsY [Verrucomicrobiota bacterium]MDI9372660.1 signal recognition particle-docking protein FtsY [Verrucomicrobiota bacterium]
MGLFAKFKAGLQKTHSKLAHEIKRIVTRSPKLDAAGLEELEGALLAADLGPAVSGQILRAVRQAYETQGSAGREVFAIARREVERCLGAEPAELRRAPQGLTVVSIVGVNGTGKTTTAAKLAHRVQTRGHKALLAACDTFRAAAIEQLRLWGQRLQVEVIAGAYGADAAAVAHDAVAAGQARGVDYLLVDTAGRLHTKHNLMQELQKLHRVMNRQLPGAPHEVLLVLDATTGMNALNQAREFNKAVPLSGLIVTKLDGTSKGGMVVAIQQELNLPVKYLGLGEQADDLQPFDAKQFAGALFGE